METHPNFATVDDAFAPAFVFAKGFVFFPLAANAALAVFLTLTRFARNRLEIEEFFVKAF